MKKPIAIITAASLMMIFAVVCFATEPSDPRLTQTLARMYDPVITTGDETDLLGEPIANYGLYAIKDGIMLQVPFQIDERDEDGLFVLTEGKNPTTDGDNGLFDENDELVFMARDAGDRLFDKEMLPEGRKAVSELEITDPLTDGTAWAYLIAFGYPQQPPADYVVYNPGCQMISTAYYSAGFDPAYAASPADYTFKEGLDGNGEDFLDRAKVRITMRALGITLHRSEEDIKVEEIGYIDGPIRVVVYNRTLTPLLLGIPASNTKQYSYFYDMHANFGFAAAFPLKPGYFRVTIIDDFKDAIGWTFYNSNNPEGHVIDGNTGPADNSLDRSPWKWSALTNGAQSFWSRWKAPEGSPVKASLYFNDDMNAEDDQENDPGERPGIGFDFIDGWDEFDEDRIELRLIHFFTKGYTPSMVPMIMRVYDAPLVVSEHDVDLD